MYKIYILQSSKTKRYYIGQTENLTERILRHNSGVVRSTKNGLPWDIIYTEDHKSRTDALKREKEIKSYKGGIKFKKLLGLFKE
ncbi:MAG: GIY-YIG nuclease family protein [Patescibacteria group bacterium]|nr:GIY-YIG nuclease family protein [Patescibacteria group bacterium]